MNKCYTVPIALRKRISLLLEDMDMENGCFWLSDMMRKLHLWFMPGIIEVIIEVIGKKMFSFSFNESKVSIESVEIVSIDSILTG